MYTETYIIHCVETKDSYDMYGGGIASLMYEGVDVGVEASKELFAILTHSCLETHYTYMCYGSKNLFGCIGMRGKQYCIFNKQYSKEEYFKLVPKIIEHMNNMPFVDKMGLRYKYGEFFPSAMSNFGYNETMAYEYFPLSKEEALSNGYKWWDKVQKTTGKETLKPEQVPDSIHDVSEDILNEVLVCTGCERNYKIVHNELIFYKKHSIPIPNQCFYCRNSARLKFENPFKLYHRTCMCDKEHAHHKGHCDIEFETHYAPDRPEIIYCEKCYQQEVF